MRCGRPLLGSILATIVVAGCTAAPPAENAAENVNATNSTGTANVATNATSTGNAVAPETNAAPATKGSEASSATATNASVPERPSDDSRVYRRADLAVRNVNLAGKPFRLWIMDNGGKRQEGMMFLRDADVAADQGMLFAFTEVQKGDVSHGFWMRNCPLGLDIIYLSPENTVVNVGKGEPFSETTVKPAGDYKNVIELKQGTAARIGLKPGMKVELPKDLKPTPD